MVAATTMAEAFEKNVHPMVPVPDAIRIVLRQAATAMMKEGSVTSETLSTSSKWNDLLGRRLTEAVLMAEPGYPAYNASIMDGYAIQSSDAIASSEEGWTYAVVDKVFAGDTETKESATEVPADLLLPSAYYITTGAVIPTTCDCVVPIEQCTVSEDGAKITIDKSTPIEPGKWIRGVGCDIAAHSVVLPKGHMLDPVSLGLLLQSGQSMIHVQKKLLVGVLSTGNELLSGAANASSTAGKIPDANRPILLSLLSTFGSDISPIDLGMQRDDDLDSLSDALRAALDQCHVVITTGGISMGESDILEQVLIQRLGGTLHFGRLHMKPGKPTTFITTTATVGDNRTRFVFCMPGNPVSATVCTQLIVRPCLDLLSHQDNHADVHGESVNEMLHRMMQNAWVHPERKATLAHDMKLDKERPEYHRVVLIADNNNKLMASSTGVQRSSRLMNLRDAHGLLVLPQGVVGKRMLAKAGEKFTVLLLKTNIHGVQVSKSEHLNKKAHKSFQIAVVHVVDPASTSDESTAAKVLQEVSDKVRTALSGSKSGTADIVSSKTFCGPAVEIYSAATTKGNDSDVDVTVVVCRSSFPGSFLYQLDVAASLRQRLVKVADTMALQARRGVASESAASALMETVVGYVPTADGGGSMLMLVPEEGLQGGLSNVRGLLKHALKVARLTG